MNPIYFQTRGPVKVEKIRHKLFVPEDLVRVNCDATSIKSFITYMVKRHDGSVRRESW